MTKTGKEIKMFYDSPMGRGTGITKKTSLTQVNSKNKGLRKKSPALNKKPKPHAKKGLSKKLSPYEKFMKDNLNMHYITSEKELKKASDYIRSLGPAKIGLDFETASKNNRFGLSNGSIRLIQIGIGEPERGIKPEQFVIDCHQVNPERIVSLLSSRTVEKQIQNLNFEQSWSYAQLGIAINNIYDPMHAWREIHKKLKTMEPEDIEKIIPGYEPHKNSLAELCTYLGFELPKNEQASDWSNPKLSLDQLIYAANDAAVMLPLTEKTKEIVSALGIEKEVEVAIKKASKQSIERADSQVRRNSDDSARFILALRRAQSVEVLEQIYASGQVLAIQKANRARVNRVYQSKLEELS